MDLEWLDVLSLSLQREVADDIARRSDKQSTLARKQRQIIAALADVRKRGQGKRNDLHENTSCTSNRVQVSRRRNTTEIVAGWYDEGASAVYQRIEVLEAAEKDREKYGKFLQEMDEADSPHAAHKHLREAQRKDRFQGDEVPQEGEPVVRRGDRWILGNHVLVCGDATSAADVNKLLAGATPHLMVTDPPYGVRFDAAWRSKVLGRRRVPRSVINDDRADWRAAYALFPGHVAYAFCGKLNSDTVIADLEAVGLARRDKLIWVKPQFIIGGGDYQSQYEEFWYVVRPGRDSHWNGGRDKSDVWMIGRANDGRDDRTSHGTQKPVECMRLPIENSSKPGDAVYDPFVGSGTTIIAAEISDRCCYAMDIDPIFCTVAIERWQKYTGQQARLGATGQTFDAVKAERSPVAAQAQVDPPLEIAVAEESSSGDQV
jgi:DNA modification methylase